MTDFDYEGELTLGHRIPEAILNQMCVTLTGRTCDVEFTGVTESARIPTGELGEILMQWRSEIRAQAIVAYLIESADEFDEAGMPTHTPAASRRLERLAPMRTPGGLLRASPYAVGELARVREAVPDYGDVEDHCLACTVEVGE